MNDNEIFDSEVQTIDSNIEDIVGVTSSTETIQTIMIESDQYEQILNGIDKLYFTTIFLGILIIFVLLRRVSRV